MDGSLELLDLFYFERVASDSSMDAECFVVSSLVTDDGSQRKICEELVDLLESTFRLINVFSKTLRALSSEAHKFVNSWVLVVSSKQEDMVRKSDLQAHQKTDDFKRELSTINIVSKENIGKVLDVSLLRRTLPDIEEPHQIVEVSVQVSEDFNWCFDVVDYDGLRQHSYGGFIRELDDIAGLEHEFGGVLVVLVLLRLHQLLQKHEGESFVRISDVISVLSLESRR